MKNLNINISMLLVISLHLISLIVGVGLLLDPSKASESTVRLLGLYVIIDVLINVSDFIKKLLLK
jgi:uncharacterized membrane protein HdeD (DUF308 family)